jgi:ATP/ADP translocase
MSEAFFAAAVMTPLMVLLTAGIIFYIGIRSNDRERRLARERGETSSP